LKHIPLAGCPVVFGTDLFSYDNLLVNPFLGRITLRTEIAGPFYEVEFNPAILGISAVVVQVPERDGIDPHPPVAIQEAGSTNQFSIFAGGLRISFYRDQDLGLGDALRQVHEQRS